MSKPTTAWTQRKKTIDFFSCSISIKQSKSSQISTRSSPTNTPPCPNLSAYIRLSTAAHKSEKWTKTMPCTFCSVWSHPRPKNQSTAWSVHKESFAHKYKAYSQTDLLICFPLQSNFSISNPTWSKFSDQSFPNKDMPYAKLSETVALTHLISKHMDGKTPKKIALSSMISFGCSRVGENKTLLSAIKSMRLHGTPHMECVEWNTLTWIRTHMSLNLSKISTPK